MDGSEDVILDDPFADEDGVFEVVSVPGHERAKNVAPQRQFAAGGARPVGNDLPLLHRLGALDQDLLIDAGRRVRAHEFADGIGVEAFLRIVPDFLFAFGQLAIFGNDDLIAGDRGHLAAFLGHDDSPRIARHALFQSGGDQRRFSDDQRHRLTLHVRSHQSAVGVVVLQERDQTGRHRHQLFRRYVHVIDPRGLDIDEVAFATAGHPIGREVAPIVQRRISLGDDKRLLAIGRQVIDVTGDAPLLRLAIRRFDKTEVVDARERRQRRNQADVRTFRSFHRTNAAVVRRVHVAHLESGAIARETARPQRGEAALVGQLGQRIDLIHELRELAASEEIPHDGGQGLGIDQFLGRHRFHALIEERHAFFDQTLRARQADAALIRQQFAHGPDATAAQVINVVQTAFALLQPEQIFRCAYQVFLGQNA